MFNFLALLDIRVFGRLYITIVASDWPRTFFTPKVFLFSIPITYLFLLFVAFYQGIEGFLQLHILFNRRYFVLYVRSSV